MWREAPALGRPPRWSPWLFVIVAVLAIMSYAVLSAGEEVASPRMLGA
jgi:hypothetical protein